MGIAAHSAIRHWELCQTVHESEANMSVTGCEKPKKLTPPHGWPYV